jgi:hypothetical protein
VDGCDGNVYAYAWFDGVSKPLDDLVVARQRFFTPGQSSCATWRSRCRTCEGYVEISVVPDEL